MVVDRFSDYLPSFAKGSLNNIFSLSVSIISKLNSDLSRLPYNDWVDLDGLRGEFMIEEVTGGIKLSLRDAGLLKGLFMFKGTSADLGYVVGLSTVSGTVVMYDSSFYDAHVVIMNLFLDKYGGVFGRYIYDDLDDSASAVGKVSLSEVEINFKRIGDRFSLPGNDESIARIINNVNPDVIVGDYVSGDSSYSVDDFLNFLVSGVSSGDLSGIDMGQLRGAYVDLVDDYSNRVGVASVDSFLSRECGVDAFYYVDLGDDSVGGDNSGGSGFSDASVLLQSIINERLLACSYLRFLDVVLYKLETIGRVNFGDESVEVGYGYYLNGQSNNNNHLSGGYDNFAAYRISNGGFITLGNVNDGFGAGGRFLSGNGGSLDVDFGLRDESLAGGFGFRYVNNVLPFVIDNRGVRVIGNDSYDDGLISESFNYSIVTQLNL